MRQIRRGVFETNSSSVHSITMCMEDDFEKFRNGETWYVRETYGLPDNLEIKEFVTPDEARDLLAKSKYYDGEDPHNLTDEEVLEAGEEYFWDYEGVGYGEYETYEDSFTTPSGETVVAFGYYGHD